MKTSLKLESIGDGANEQYRFYHKLFKGACSGLGNLAAGIQKDPFWVKQIISEHESIRITGRKDYSESTGSGLRGVFVHYILDSAHIYKIKEMVSWKRTVIYFVKVTDDGDIVQISEDEVKVCWQNKNK